MEKPLSKLNLGCGTDIRPSTETEHWTHADSAPLDGVDVVCDLTKFPWPLPDNAYDEIIAYDILEHLPDTVRSMEEIWRILKPGGLVEFRIPYWNSLNYVTDPTHVKQFNHLTLTFWDVDSEFYKKRSYYTTARYRTESLMIQGHFWRIGFHLYQGFRQKLILKLSQKIGNITHNMYIKMRAVKD